MKKKMLALLLAAAMVMGLAAPAMAAEDTDSQDGVVVFYTNDVHTYIDNSYTVDEESGQEAPALRYSTVAALKASVPGSLLVDAGDHVQGTAYGSMDKGATIIELMNAAGYDLATLGNHEFDYGMEGAMAAIEAADFPYVSCNFYHEENGLAGDPVLDAYRVFDVDGVKVAFVGVTTPESFTKSTPAYFQDGEGNYIYGIAGGEDGSALYEAVQTAIDAAAKEADYVIGLGHLGVDASSQPWTSKEVIANTTGLDAFIDGHSHSTVAMETVADKAGEDVVLTQTGSYLSNVGKLTIAADGTITTELLGIGDLADLTPDADVQAMEDAWISEIETQLGQVVGSFADEMTNYDGETRLVRSQETNVGDFCADALYYLFDNMGLDVDVAVMNGGGIRNTTTTGEISYLTCKEIHTFGNVACLQTVTGQQILDALEWGAKDGGVAENGGLLQVSGLKYTINTAIPSTVQADEKGVWTGAPTGDYRVTDVQVLNSETGTYEPLDLTASYNLACYNYTLRDLGDGFAMFEGAVNVLDYVMEDYMVLANYVQSFEDGVVTGYAEPQGRITVVNEAAAETPADWADVDAAAWYAEAVNYVIENGIMGSTSTDAKVFTPDGTVTRATVYQTLYNLEGKPAVTEAATFTDVAGTWYADSAAWAEDTGLTTGDGTGAYAGDRAVTRAELATIFARYAEYKGLATTAGDLSTYADAADVAEWAADGMSVAVGSGIMGGKPGNLLDPNGTAVRTELATILLNFSKVPEASKGYTETAVSIEVPETDGIPAHTIPAIVTVPDGEGPFAAVVMLHGTGSDKHEAGMGYDYAAPVLAEAGIATIRFDFMGNGESTASYSDYCYTSANIDAKAAADYVAALENVNADKIGVMGWSQGGTNALLAAAAYPETFKAVVTWSGATALDGSTLFAEGFDAAYETAKADGVYTMTFDWREPLEVGIRWFEEVESTDVLKETAKITAPVVAINGDLDTTVTPDNAIAIRDAAQNGTAWLIDGADHTYNVFTEADHATILKTAADTAAFFQQAFDGALSGTITAVSKYGNVTTSISLEALSTIDAVAGDILTITVNGEAMDVPYGTAYSDVDNGSVISLPDTDTNTLAVAINMGNFAETYKAGEGTVITVAMKEKAGYLEEYQIRNIDSLRTNDRADYASDEVFANFRPVVMGDIAEGVLYRSSSPVNPELGRNTYADELAEAAGIKTVLNLADNEETMKAYEGYADSYYATLNVVALDMGVDFAAEDFNAKLKTGLEYLIANEGPYLVHCNEGKDRAGFTTALLEAVMGASVEEIKADYMTSYENYYHVEKDSEQYEKIAESNIMNSLCTIAGVEESADLAGVDLAAAAETYLTETVGLSAEQVDALQAVLSGTAAEAEQAA